MREFASGAERRLLLMPRRVLFEGVGEAEDGFFAEGFAEELEAEGELWL